MVFLWALAAAVTAIAVVALGLRARRQLVWIRVDGWSMEPTLRDGDRILVRRTGCARLKPGRIVVVQQPEPDLVWAGPPCTSSIEGYNWMVKRVAAMAADPLPQGYRALRKVTEPTVPSGQLLVVGDNVAESFDSRTLGFIPCDRVLGVMLWRLASPAPSRATASDRP
jgi:signal peptidase I